MKYRKLILGILLGIVFLFPQNILAKEYRNRFDDIAKWIPNTYIVKEKDGRKKYQQMSLIKRREDGQFVYCIEPGAAFDKNAFLIGYDENHASWANITEEEWQKIMLLAYYGYGYGTHTDLKWYSVTQFLIWKTIPRGYDIYFTDTLNGKRIEKYTQEIAELEQLVQNHLVKPSWEGQTISLQLGEERRISDGNKVSSLYTLVDEIEGIKKEGDDLIVKALQLGKTSFHFERKVENLSPPIIYVDPTLQDILVRGAFLPMNSSFSIEAKGGSVTLKKRATNDTSFSISPSLEGAIYGIYHETGKKIGTIQTNQEGVASTEATLPLGVYYLLEEKAPSGYLLDTQKHVFEITVENPNPTVEVEEEMITSKVKVVKIDASTKEPLLLPGIRFKIKNLDTGQYVCETNSCEFETKEDGTFVTSKDLPFGTYQLEEVKQVIKNYLWQESPLLFSINESTVLENDPEFGPIITLFFENIPVKGQLEILKYGEKVEIEKGNYFYQDILLDDVWFQLYAAEDIYSANQILQYRKGELVEEFQTENGFYCVDDLWLGEYYLVEKETVHGHLLDPDKKYFTLSDEGENIPIVSHSIIWKNELSKANVLITKIDAETKERIPDTQIALYTADGELLSKGTTNQEGTILFENLFVGKFYLIETKAADGYYPTDKKVYFEVLEGQKEVLITMENEKMVDIPHTGVEGIKKTGIMLLPFLLAMKDGLVLLYCFQKIKK